MSRPAREVLRNEIRALVSKLAGAAAFTDELDVFEAGIVRSINLLELIVGIEDAYAIEIGQGDVFDGHLRSVDRLVAFVEGRLP
jgi:acyl carrier protein